MNLEMDKTLRLAFGFALLVVLFGGYFSLAREALAGGLIILGGCILMAAACFAPAFRPLETSIPQEQPTKLLDPSMFPRR